jgi:hypothetical protein
MNMNKLLLLHKYLHPQTSVYFELSDCKPVTNSEAETSPSMVTIMKFRRLQFTGRSTRMGRQGVHVQLYGNVTWRMATWKNAEEMEG